MAAPLLLAVVLACADPASAAAVEAATDKTIAAAIEVPELAPKADLAFLAQRWDRAVPFYQQLVEANPTVGLYWWRLGESHLQAGHWDEAVQAFERSHELGAFQWSPLRIAYHGESAWGLAAAHAEAGRKEDAVRWTKIALEEGLRDIRRFHGKHFRALLKDPAYRKLVWADDVKDLSRDEGFRHDLRFLLHEAKRMHFDPFRATKEAEIDALAARLDADIASLSDEQILVRMMRIMRAFGDGHTQIQRRSRQPARLPINLFVFPEGLFIVAADDDHRGWWGPRSSRSETARPKKCWPRLRRSRSATTR